MKPRLQTKYTPKTYPLTHQCPQTQTSNHVTSPPPYQCLTPLVDSAQTGCCGSKDHIDEAASLYNQAGKAFKISQKWEEAAKAFTESATLYTEASMKMECCDAFKEAGHCYKELAECGDESPTKIASYKMEAINVLESAAEMCMDAQRYTPAANLWQEVSTIHESRISLLEKDSNEWKQAIEASIAGYKKSSELFGMDNQVNIATKMKLKEAMILSEHLNAYPRAIKIFEDVGRDYSENSNLKYNAKNYFFMAGLCHLANCLYTKETYLDVSSAVEKYQDLDPSFDTQRECKFFIDAVAALEELDVTLFETNLDEYKRIKDLDKWQSVLLDRILVMVKALPDSAAADDVDLNM